MRRLRPHDRATILLVDDDREFRSILTEVLRDEDCYVAQAENGADALQMLASLRPDLVIVDLAMPVMNGWQFMRALKEDDRFADIPVAVLSAWPDATLAHESRVLRKPVDLPNLLGLLAAIEDARRVVA
jgi:CheY-like chemotaxis protein